MTYFLIGLIKQYRKTSIFNEVEHLTIVY